MVSGLALVLGVASMTFGANGDFFKVGKSNVSTGVYTVKFNRSVSDCVRVASVGRELSFGGKVRVAASFVSGDSTGTFNGGGVTVVTCNSAGSLTDLGFHLAVFCQGSYICRGRWAGSSPDRSRSEPWPSFRQRRGKSNSTTLL